MKKILITIIIVFSWFSILEAKYDKLAYDFSFSGVDGKEILLSNYKEKVIIVVNVASRCGFTYQYEDLQNLYSKYKSQNVVVIGVPSNNFKQEPGTNSEIKEFCETNFGTEFPITEKNNVIGKNAHPFFLWAKKNYGLSASPKWNFHKIIINKKGKVAKTFTSITRPSSKKFTNTIEELLKK